MEKSYKEYLAHIRAFILDVDGVLTDGSIQISTNGELLRTMNIKDGFAMKHALDKGYTICVISGGKNEGVRHRLKNLGITDIFMGCEDKTEKLEEFFEIYNINPSEVIYMGDDIPDLYPMKKVGLACCPQDAAPEIKEVCQYISHKKGGKGCVRDIIEQVMKVQGKWV
ncbi:MAG TPA: HAD-IIIA family hydrolase [Salinimicrobium sp.]|nr:HAD-IIIA family hydrolase [Salinimicrobium sp.]